SLSAKGVVFPFGRSPNVHCRNRRKILAVSERTKDEFGGRAPVSKVTGQCPRRRNIVSAATGIDNCPARSHQRGEKAFQVRVPRVSWTDANCLPSGDRIYVKSAGRRWAGERGGVGA